MSGTNRDRVREPKSGNTKSWCLYCDRTFLGEGARCRVCRKRNRSVKRNKKPSVLPEETDDER